MCAPFVASREMRFRLNSGRDRLRGTGPHSPAPQRTPEQGLSKEEPRDMVPLRLQRWEQHQCDRGCIKHRGKGAGEAKILIDPFLSDNPSRDNGWSGYLTGKNSTQGGGR